MACLEWDLKGLQGPLDLLDCLDLLELAIQANRALGENLASKVNEGCLEVQDQWAHLGIASSVTLWLLKLQDHLLKKVLKTVGN